MLNIENAPTSPRTTRSSYLNPHNNTVVNHNIQISFSNFPYPRPFTNDESDNTHTVHVQNIDPKKVLEESQKAIQILIESGVTEADKPKFAIVWQQVVGETNDSFEEKSSVFELNYPNTTKH